MQIFKFKYLLPLLFVALFTASCAEGSDANGNNGNIESADEAIVTFNLMTSRGALEPAANDNELITSYMIVVADQNSKIVKVLTSENLPAAEMHSVKAKLTSGTYKVYGFANIPFNKLPVFTEGSSLPSDLASLYYSENSIFRNGWDGPVPMSSKVGGQELTILPSKGTVTYGIEVIRMLAKVEFEFMNSSYDNVYIDAISMGSLTNTYYCGVPLLAYNDATDLTFSSGYVSENYTHTLPQTIYVASGDVTTKPKASFYVVESKPDPVTGGFTLAFNVQRGSETAELRYALLDKALVTPTGTNIDGDSDQSPFIRRNDWLRIPIDLGDYEVRLDARSFPPIGGYPQAQIETRDNEFRVNFQSQGDFIIHPSVRKYGSTNWIYLDDTSVIDSYTFTVDTSSTGFTDIFSKTPTKRGSEIYGAIKADTHGTALVTLTVNIKLGGGVIRTLTRKLYITVQ